MGRCLLPTTGEVSVERLYIFKFSVSSCLKATCSGTFWRAIEESKTRVVSAIAVRFERLELCYCLEHYELYYTKIKFIKFVKSKMKNVQTIVNLITKLKRLQIVDFCELNCSLYY